MRCQYKSVHLLWFCFCFYCSLWFFFSVCLRESVRVFSISNATFPHIYHIGMMLDREPVQSDTELSNTRAHKRTFGPQWICFGWLALDSEEGGVWCGVRYGGEREKKESTNNKKKVKHRLMQINSSDLCIANWYLFIYSFLSWVWVCVRVFSFPFVLPRWDVVLLLLLFMDLHRSIRRWDRLRYGHTIPSFIRNLFVRPSSMF